MTAAGDIEFTVPMSFTKTITSPPRHVYNETGPAGEAKVGSLQLVTAQFPGTPPAAITVSVVYSAD